MTAEPSPTFHPNTEGIFLGLPESVYRAAPGVNISTLKLMGRSPAHYAANLVEPDESTKAQEFGTVFHARLLLPPDLAKAAYVVQPPDFNGRTNAGKEWKAAQTVPVITKEESDQCDNMLFAVRKHRVAGAILERAQCEVSGFVRHEPTGLLLKGRCDLMAMDDRDKQVIADCKTCEDASEDAFRREIGKWRYDRQAAYYLPIFGALEFLFIAVEKSPPYAVNVIRIHPTDLQQAHEQNERDLARLVECETQKHFPAYGDDIKTVSVPGWVRRGE